jgi:hypothetical protein
VGCAVLVGSEHGANDTRPEDRLADGLTAFYGFGPTIAAFAFFTSWGNLIVRQMRGEEVKEDWRTLSYSVTALVSFTLVSGARARETAALRRAPVQLRGIASETAAQHPRRDERSAERAAQDTVRQDRLNQLTRSLLLVAGITLTVAIVALAVAIVQASS